MNTPEYKEYRRKPTLTLMADWVPGMDMEGVSISKADLAKGCPKPGDKIARNPKDHDDRWLVEAEYAKNNFDLVD